MATLTKKRRAKLPKKDFAGPDGSFPVENKAHAKAALMDAGISKKKGNITAAEKKKIDAKARQVLAKGKKK